MAVRRGSPLLKGCPRIQAFPLLWLRQVVSMKSRVETSARCPDTIPNSCYLKVRRRWWIGALLHNLKRYTPQCFRMELHRSTGSLTTLSLSLGLQQSWSLLRTRQDSWRIVGSRNHSWICYNWRLGISSALNLMIYQRYVAETSL